MVKRGRRYGVHEVLPQRTVQDHLFIRHTSAIFTTTHPQLILNFDILWLFVFYLFVPQPLTADEELGVAGGRHGGQLRRQEAAHADPAQSSPVLGQPAPTRVVPRHHHRFHTHDVAVTGERERKRERGRIIRQTTDFVLKQPYSLTVKAAYYDTCLCDVKC